MNEIIFEEVRCAKCKLELRDLLDAAFRSGPDNMAMHNFYACSRGGTHEFTQVSSVKKEKDRSRDPSFTVLVDEIFEMISNHGWILTDLVEASVAASLRYHIQNQNKKNEYF
jgi:hypothetical protein